MPNLNKVLLMGNLTRNPEVRVTPKGTTICNFSIAINRTWKDESGAKKEDVTYVDITAWGKQGEVIAKYLTKGKPIYVEGRLVLESWEDKTTHEKRSRMRVTMEQFQFIGGREEEPAAAGGGKPQEPDSDVPY